METSALLNLALITRVIKARPVSNTLSKVACHPKWHQLQNVEAITLIKAAESQAKLKRLSKQIYL
jgi:hypothetical protein